MKTRDLAYFLSGALMFFGGGLVGYTNLTDQSRNGRYLGNVAGSIMFLIGSISCCYLYGFSEEDGENSVSETKAILPSKNRRPQNNAFALSSDSGCPTKDTAMLQFVDNIKQNLISSPISLTLSYQSILNLWRELIQYARTYPRNSCAVEQKLKDKVLEMHGFLLKNPEENKSTTALQKLILQDLPTNDYFSQLINYGLKILNLKLSEDDNILKFIKETFPQHVQQLESSQLNQNTSAPHSFY